MKETSVRIPQQSNISLPPLYGGKIIYHIPTFSVGLILSYSLYRDTKQFGYYFSFTFCLLYSSKYVDSSFEMSHYDHDEETRDSLQKGKFKAHLYRFSHKYKSQYIP